MKNLPLLTVMPLLWACAAQTAPRPTTAPPVIDRSSAAPRATNPSAPEPSTVSPPPQQAIVSLPVAPVSGSLAERADVQVFIREMSAAHGFDIHALNALFSRARTRPDIIALMTRPAEGKPWYAYREIFLTSRRIDGGVAFWRKYRAALSRAEQTYGVPAEVIVAIIGVETQYGGNMGKHRVLEALATLAFDYPRRSEFFRKELESYLVLSHQEGIDPLAVKGSYAGAMGYGQFMPSSYISYAVDFDGDQHRDLWDNPLDAIGSVANYLSEHRWRSGGPIASPARVEGSGYRALIGEKLEKPQHPVARLRRSGVTPLRPVSDDEPAMLLQLDARNGPEHWLGFANFYVITRYNHSALYAMAVYQLSQEIRRRFVLQA